MFWFLLIMEDNVRTFGSVHIFYNTPFGPLSRRFVFRVTACFHHAITQYERIRYSGIQRHVTRWLVPDVSTQRAGPIFKGTKSNVQFFNEHSTLEDEINSCHETSGTNHLATQTCNAKERRPQLHRRKTIKLLKNLNLHQLQVWDESTKATKTLAYSNVPQR